MASSINISSDEAKEVRLSLLLSSDEALTSIRVSTQGPSNENTKAETLTPKGLLERAFCDACTINDALSKEAEYFCDDCKQYLCGKCREYHEKVVLTRLHTVCQIGDNKNKDLPQVTERVEMFTDDLKDLSVIDKPNTVSREHCLTDNMYTKATPIDQFNASFEDDKRPCTLSDVLVVDNLIYIADYSNRKVKLFDINGQAISQCILQHAYAMAHIGDERIVVTSLAKFFTCISVKERKFTEVKTIQTPIHTKGVCFYNGLIYITCYSIPDPALVPQILVFTREGELIRRIEPIWERKRLLQKPAGITINRKTGILYVSDFSIGVIALSTSGKIQFVKQVFSKKDTCQGVTVDSKGQVYVCGISTHNVMAMSADGETVDEILKENCEEALGIEVSGNQMFLCCHGSDVVRGFQLS